MLETNHHILDKSLEAYRKRCRQTAKELMYPVEVRQRIRNAESEAELEMIMRTANKQRIYEEDKEKGRRPDNGASIEMRSVWYVR